MVFKNISQWERFDKEGVGNVQTEILLGSVELGAVIGQSVRWKRGRENPA